MLKRKRLFQSQSDIRAAAEIAMDVYSNHNVSYNISDISPHLIRILKENAVPIVYLYSASKELFNFDSQPDLKEEFEKYNTWKEEFIKVSNIFLQNDIDYIFIKTPSFFPYTSGNLDVLIKEKDFSKAGNLLESNGFVKLKNIRESDIKWLYRKFNIADDASPVHLHERVFWGGTFLDSESIWENRPKEPIEDIVFTLSPEDCVLTTLAHSFYENAGVRLSDLSIIKYLVEDKKIDWEYLKAIADRYKWIDGYYSSLLIYEYLHKNILENGLFPPEIIREAKNFVNKNWFLRMIVRKLLQSRITMPFYIPIVLSKTLHYKKILAYDEYGGKIQRFFHVSKLILAGIQRNYLNIKFQKPMFISLSGIDGCGKTRHATALKDIFKTCEIKSYYLWGRAGSFPLRKFIFKIRRIFFSKEINTSKAKKQKEENRIFRTFLFKKLNYYLNYIDAISYYFLKVRIPLLLGYVVISDRYIYDFMVDTAKITSHEKIEKLSNKFLLFINPKPDISLLLEADSESVYKRKNDEKIDEFKKAIDLYNEIGKMTGFIRIDTTHPFEEVNGAISYKILTQYYNQYPDMYDGKNRKD